MRAIPSCPDRVASLFLSACGYNTLQVQDEQVKSAWSEVVNQYQRRADLIPNLVNTVKGFAAQEQAVLVGVTEARAKATQIQVNANDPESLQAVPGRAGRGVERAVAPDGGRRALSGAQVRPEFPRPAGAARGHREPHHRGAQPLHPGGAGVQRHGAPVPDQPHGHGVRLQGEAELHRRERGGDRAGRRRSTSRPRRRRAGTN